MAKRLFEATTPITTIDDTLRLALGKAGQEYDNITWSDFKALFYEDWITLSATIDYRKVLFNWVEVKVTGPQFDDNTSLGTLPIGYRPTTAIQVPISSANLDPVSIPPTDNSAYVQIDATGVMTLRVSTLGSISASGSIIRIPLD